MKAIRKRNRRVAALDVNAGAGIVGRDFPEAEVVFEASQSLPDAPRP